MKPILAFAALHKNVGPYLSDIIHIYLIQITNSVKYNDLSFRFLFKNFRHIRSYEQIMNNALISFFLCLSSIFSYF